ncbi:phenylalanine--tRNA ligase beta subunit-related protein [Actinomadura fulvescens]|uniref:Phenylalanine--tRNA ligase beta subunit-related protein n=1 Tax=Actinomadura fulvescens TaxID=46160 RepID=A0ABN3PDI7_9ACTN
MYFQHSPRLWSEHPGLVAGVLSATGIDASPSPDLSSHLARAKDRLGSSPESEFPEIQAWRRTFASMGLKPTQYRCASEALLRRFRKEGALPRLHPLVDLCNAISLALAVPVAVLDLSKITGDLEVRHATGDEEYVTFGGDVEHPAPDEVVFADEAGRAHARRWTNRQSGLSAVRGSTTDVLIVAEALHDTAATDVPRLVEAVAAGLAEHWHVSPGTAILSRARPRFAVHS